GPYTVVVYNGLGTTEATANLSAGVPTEIASQPSSVTVPAGSNATFSVSASGGMCGISYQWVKAGFGNLIDGMSRVDGGESNILTLFNVSSNDAGTYSVMISNGVNVVTSSAVTLAVTYTNPLPPTITYISPILAP